MTLVEKEGFHHEKSSFLVWTPVVVLYLNERFAVIIPHDSSV